MRISKSIYWFWSSYVFFFKIKYNNNAYESRTFVYVNKYRFRICCIIVISTKKKLEWNLCMCREIQHIFTLSYGIRTVCWQIYWGILYKFVFRFISIVQNRLHVIEKLSKNNTHPTTPETNDRNIKIHDTYLFLEEWH